jgi:pimeloyl-[acyl-carrier protein] synthase
MLLFAGHEMTRNLIASGLYSLWREPGGMTELLDNPALIRTAVEELLRFESLVQYTARVAKQDIGLCAIRIQEARPSSHG